MVEVIGPTRTGAAVMAALCLLYLVGLIWWYLRGPQD